MRLSHLMVVVVSAISVLLIAVPVFSQDAGTAAAPVQELPVPAAVAEVPSQAKETAIYGEVQTVDAAAGSLSVQYYDYDSDSEKTADIAIVVDTKLENASSIGEVKKGDWVDVTYVVADGKNAAKVVTVEKEEVPASEEMPPQAPASVGVPAE